MGIILRYLWWGIFWINFLQLQSCNRYYQDSQQLASHAEDDGEIDAPDLAIQSVNSEGRFGAKAKDLFSDREFIQIGATPREAFRLALEECSIFDDGPQGCVVIQVYDTFLSSNSNRTIFQE